MKILLSAYACEPNRGSEPGVGWNIAREIANYHQVWVFTSNTHRSEIEAELTQRPIANLRIVYLDPFGWIYDWSQEDKKSYWDVHIHYYLWQIWAYFVARSLHQNVKFDLVHHVTYVKYSSPSFLSLLPVPFLWGPVGGAESAPALLLKELGLRGRLYETLRNFARRLGEWDPFVHLTAKRSAIAWATTEDTAQRLHKIGAKNVQLFSQVGLSAEEISQLVSYSTASPVAVKFISIGRLLHWKGFHLGLRAFAQAHLPDAEYWIVGDGPERKHLEDLAMELGIHGQVKFWGKLLREEALQKLGEASALIHPSLHDSGGLVCLEAMAAGRPVICLDLGGPAVQVTEATGFKLLADSVEQTVKDLASAMVELSNSPELQIRLGRAGQKRAHEQFSWSSKGYWLSEFYKQGLT